MAGGSGRVCLSKLCGRKRYVGPGAIGKIAQCSDQLAIIGVIEVSARLLWLRRVEERGGRGRSDFAIVDTMPAWLTVRAARKLCCRRTVFSGLFVISQPMHLDGNPSRSRLSPYLALMFRAKSSSRVREFVAILKSSLQTSLNTEYFPEHVTKTQGSASVVV